MSIVGTSLWRCTVRLHVSAYITVWRTNSFLSYIQSDIDIFYFDRQTQQEPLCILFHHRSRKTKKKENFVELISNNENE